MTFLSEIYELIIDFGKFYPNPIIITTDIINLKEDLEIYYQNYIDREKLLVNTFNTTWISIIKEEDEAIISSNCIEMTRVPSGFELAVIVDRIDKLIFHSDNPIYLTHWGLHAAALENDNQITLISGATQSGKSTLTAYLISKGHKYLTDDITFLKKKDCAVVPFTKPLHFRKGSRSVLLEFMPKLVNSAHILIPQEDWFISAGEFEMVSINTFYVKTMYIVEYGKNNSLKELRGPEKMLEIMKNSMPQKHILHINEMVEKLSKEISVFKLKYKDLSYVDQKLNLLSC